nr:ribonuclease P protein component [Ketogulonicigenium robustum]
MTQRRDFLLAARALRMGLPGFHLQARKRAPDEGVGGIRVGFTCSKKVGNAVARGHAKRRLREVARVVLPTAGLDGWDYVLIGREGATARADFLQMQADLARAVARLHTQAPPEASVA